MANPSRRTTSDPCRALRDAYDRCFNRWYSDVYVKMDQQRGWKKEDCDAEWKEYRSCFTKRLERSKIEQLVKTEHDALVQQSD